jgi:DNA-binding transcriptional regulator YbjK
VAVTDREVLLLDAAIQVLADGGVRRLTHRAVDAQAGLPLGSTSNRFRTRDALLAGVLRRLLEREAAIWTQLSLHTSTHSIDEFASRLGRVVEVLGEAERALTVARHAVFAEATQRSTLRAALDAGRRQLGDSLSPLLGELGSADPGGDLRRLLALVDGLLIGQLIDPAPDFTPGRTIAALLHGLWDRAPAPRP